MSFSNWLYDGFMHYFESRGLHQLRRQVFDGVVGEVLELGPGTGVNLKYCRPEKIRSMTYVDLKFREGLEDKALKACRQVRLVEGDAQHLPFPDASFDSVVFTLVFCSVEDPLKGLKEVRRVLKDGGAVFFIEHVEPPHGRLKPVFNTVNPAWKRIAGGCNLNRRTFETIREAGFEVEEIGKAFKGIFIAGIAQKSKN